MEKINKEEKDILFIISINSLGVTRDLIDEMSAMKMKTMLVYDIPSSMAYSHARFLSKKDTIDHTIRFLMLMLLGQERTLINITLRQSSIIRRLAEGQRQFFISDVEERSAKTISGIKKNITDKVGLKAMNDLSLLLADIVIRTTRIRNL